MIAERMPGYAGLLYKHCRVQDLGVWCLGVKGFRGWFRGLGLKILGLGLNF